MRINLKLSNSKEKLNSFINWVLIGLVILSTIGFSIILVNMEQGQRGFTPEGQFWAFLLITSATLAFFHVLIIDIIRYRKKENKDKKKSKLLHINPKLALTSKFLIFSGTILAILLTLVFIYILIFTPYIILLDLRLLLELIGFFIIIGVIMLTIGLYMAIYKNAWQEQKTEESLN